MRNVLLRSCHILKVITAFKAGTVSFWTPFRPASCPALVYISVLLILLTSSLISSFCYFFSCITCNLVHFFYNSGSPVLCFLWWNWTSYYSFWNMKISSTRTLSLVAYDPIVWWCVFHMCIEVFHVTSSPRIVTASAMLDFFLLPAP